MFFFSSQKNTQRWYCWLYGSSVFNFLKNFHTVFYSGNIILHSHQRCMKLPFLCILANTYCFLSLIVPILTSVRWYLVMVLICTSLMISDVEHLFMCLLLVCKSSLESMQVLCLFLYINNFYWSMVALLCLFFNWVVWFFG